MGLIWTLCDFVAFAGTFAMAALRYSGPTPSIATVSRLTVLLLHFLSFYFYLQR